MLLLFCASTAWAQSPSQTQRFDWLPPEEGDARSRAGESADQIIPAIIVLRTPVATADKSKFTSRYEIELAKFNISNDGTNAAATSKGINAALQHAKEIKAQYIVFPKGTYLIDPVNDPIILDLTDAIIDLNGSTLQAMANDQQKSRMIQFVHGANNLRLTNGIVRGDRDTHDYHTVQGTHEWATGIGFDGGKNLELDHVKIENFPGDGLSSSVYGSRNRPELLARIVDSVKENNLEQGAFDASGNATESTQKLRTIKPYDMTKANGEFELGYTGGYMGYPNIRGRVYQSYYYDQDMQFIKMERNLQYHKVQLPENAKYMHLEFNQPQLFDAVAGMVVRITNFTPSVKVHMHDNVIENNRRLGFAMCGGQEWVIENNLFIGNGGSDPGFGIDFEDGWEMVQHVVFRNNKFKDNVRGDFVAVSSSELIVEGNEFEKAVIITGRVHNYFFRNNRLNGSDARFITRTGIAYFYNNRYENGRLQITFDTKAVADGLYREPGKTVVTPPVQFKNETLINMKEVTGTYFDFVNCRLDRVNFEAGADTRLVHFKNNLITNSRIHYETQGPAVLVDLKGNRGTLGQQGPGLERRQIKK